MRIFSLVFFLSFYSILVWSQPLPELKFERITSGISSLNVGPILQDRQGFLWFCTAAGLNRYDGYGFRVFKRVSGDSTSLNTDIVTGIYETRDGKIWACTYRGFSVFDPVKEQFSHIELPDQQFGNCVYEDASGLLWLGTTKGLYLHDRRTRDINKVEIQHLGHVTALCGGKNDMLWISSFNGLFRYDPQTGQHKQYFLPKSAYAPIAKQIVKISAQDAQGRLWLTTWEAGVHRFDPETETFESYFNTGKKGHTLASNITCDVAIAPDGHIWIANASGGMAILEPETGQISIHKHSPDDEFSLPGNFVQNVFCDRQGIIWVSTEHGIAKFNSRASFFETCLLERRDGNITNTEFWAVHADRDGELWVGNYWGVYRINLQNGRMENLTQQITGSPIRGGYPILEDEDGTLWIFSKGIFSKVKKKKKRGRWDQMTHKRALLSVEKVPLVPHSINAWDIVPVGNREFWVAGSDGGIYRFDKVTGKTAQFLPDSARDGIQRAPVHSLVALPDGTFLAGIRETGLVRFIPADGLFHKIDMKLPNGITPTVLNSIFCDNQNRIWIGTETEGLFQTDLALRSFRQFTEQDGLPSLRIMQIMDDAEGRLWIVSSAGLSLYNIDKQSFVNFGTAAGLRNPDALSTMCKDRSGRFYLGDLGYLQMFDPSKAIPSTNKFSVYITAMKAGVTPVVAENWSKDLRFIHDQNYISFEFVALNFDEPGKTAYAYLLEGLNRNWQEVTDKRFVTFAGLPPGGYRFRVRAAGKDGIWQECTQAIPFRISGPFWQSWWFLLACTMALAGVVYSFYRMKINRLQAELAIRNSIARDLHDDVGSTLSGVNVISALALKKLKTKPESVAALLAQIAQKTTAMSDAMGDIVWSVNPKNDSLQNLVVRMKEYAAEMLEPRDIRYRFSIDDRLLTQKLPLGLRKDFYLIFKEALNNLSKHSACQVVNISIVLTHKWLEMTVTDDGKGFDETAVRPGNGLANLRARATNLGGKIEITSKIGAGTTLRCTLPIP
jgi:ligand-binding sensor domain-containing protein/signal transduction histidine kinase